MHTAGGTVERKAHEEMTTRTDRQASAPGEETGARGGILGTGIAVPERVVTNAWFAERLETSDEWIKTRTGIAERRFAEPGERTSDYAAAAGRRAIEDSGLSPDQIGLLVVATSVPDVRIPATANFVARELGLRNACAYDVSAACSGFIFALSAADAQLRTGLAEHALVIGADLYSSIMDFTDRGTCVLFGDGAGAAVVAAPAPSGGPGILCTYLHSDGDHADILGCRGGGTADRTEICAESVPAAHIHMQGPLVFRLAVKGCCESIRRVLQAEKIRATDIARIVPHQANLRIIHKIADDFDYPLDRIEVNLDRYGNTAAASIPIALHEARAEGRIAAGDLVLLVAAGAGFNSGAILIRA